MNDTNVPLLGQNKEEDSPVVEAVTAMLVYTTKEGVTMFTPDINLPLVIERQASGNEILNMANSVRDEVIMSNTASLAGQAAMAAIMQQMAHQMEQVRNQQILNKAGLAR